MAPYQKDGSPLMVDGAPASHADCCCCCLDANDDFGGTGDNSGSVGDSNWDCRWAQATAGTPPTDEIANNQWETTISTGTTGNVKITTNADTDSNNYTVQATFEIANSTTSGTGGLGGLNCHLVSSGSIYIEVGYLCSGTHVGGCALHAFVGGGAGYTVDTLLSSTDPVDGTWTFKLVRVGNTVTAYVDGVSVTSATETGNPAIYIDSANTAGGAKRAGGDGNWDTFTLIDGSSNPYGLCL